MAVDLGDRAFAAGIHRRPDHPAAHRVAGEHPDPRRAPAVEHPSPAERGRAGRHGHRPGIRAHLGRSRGHRGPVGGRGGGPRCGSPSGGPPGPPPPSRSDPPTVPPGIRSSPPPPSPGPDASARSTCSRGWDGPPGRPSPASGSRSSSSPPSWSRASSGRSCASSRRPCCAIRRAMRASSRTCTSAGTPTRSWASRVGPAMVDLFDKLGFFRIFSAIWFVARPRGPRRGHRLLHPRPDPAPVALGPAGRHRPARCRSSTPRLPDRAVLERGALAADDVASVLRRRRFKVRRVTSPDGSVAMAPGRPEPVLQADDAAHAPRASSCSSWAAR